MESSSIRETHRAMGRIIVRLLFLGITASGGIAFGRALGLSVSSPLLAAAGLLTGLLILLVEEGLRRVSLQRIFLATLGTVLGVVAAQVLGWSFLAPLPGFTRMGGTSFLSLLLGYLGLTLALRKAGELEALTARLFPHEAGKQEHAKILDTSVIIDGRIADICETGFVDGVLLVPQFILRELQQIADSSDGLKRNRGRRGLDILQRIQRMTNVKVEIRDLDFPQIREVDRKLIEFAKTVGGRVLTNDYNLNKVAELHGVGVLNINELANAVKPVVLPGEQMHVHVLREGKEFGQGVAYLDDGTMVVVDHGKRYLGQSVDVIVTSVLQTTAGRMIFSRLKEENGGRGVDER